VYFTEPIFTKLRLARHCFVKNIDTKFYENPTRGIVADTTSRTDRRGLHFIRCYVLRGGRVIEESLHEDYGSFSNDPTLEPFTASKMLFF
jgi:hypothetical protein